MERHGVDREEDHRDPLSTLAARAGGVRGRTRRAARLRTRHHAEPALRTAAAGLMRGWQLWRAERRLRIAGYWWARGDLVAALPHVRRAWHLVRLHPAPPAALAVRAPS